LSDDQKLGSDDAYMGPGGPPMAGKRSDDVSLYNITKELLNDAEKEIAELKASLADRIAQATADALEVAAELVRKRLTPVPIETHVGTFTVSVGGPPLWEEILALAPEIAAKANEAGEK
jgi:hypothetical protein